MAEVADAVDEALSSSLHLSEEVAALVEAEAVASADSPEAAEGHPAGVEQAVAGNMKI